MRWLSNLDGNEELLHFLQEVGNEVPLDSLEGIFDLPLECDRLAPPSIPSVNATGTITTEIEEIPQEWPWNGWKFEDYSKKP